MRLLIAVLVLTAASVASAAAQPATPLPFPTAAPVPQLSPMAEVTMLTMLPGREVYSLWGHTALRVHDPVLDIDRTYNYGTFDFNQPNFLLRFLRGQMDYQLSVSTMDRTLAEYYHARRPVIEQRLALDAAEKQAVFLYLESNYLPQQRVYRYDFLFDNCSTRPRDALEWALGERLDFGGYAPDARSFRELLDPYTAADPVLDFGIALGFGRPVDRQPTAREAHFLPFEIFRALDVATVDGRPLVATTDTLFWIDGAGMPERALDWVTLLAWLLLAGGLALTLAGRTRFLRVFDTVLLVFAGALGLILATLWFATEHRVTHANPDLLWAWPTHLVLAFLLGRGNEAAWLRVYAAAAGALAFVAAFVALFGFVAMHAAVIPLGLLIALRASAWIRSTSPAPQPVP
jgi:hypothetical protein